MGKLRGVGFELGSREGVLGTGRLLERADFNADIKQQGVRAHRFALRLDKRVSHVLDAFERGQRLRRVSPARIPVGQRCTVHKRRSGDERVRDGLLGILHFPGEAKGGGVMIEGHSDLR